MLAVVAALLRRYRLALALLLATLLKLGLERVVKAAVSAASARAPRSATPPSCGAT